MPSLKDETHVSEYDHHSLNMPCLQAPKLVAAIMTGTTRTRPRVEDNIWPNSRSIICVPVRPTTQAMSDPNAYFVVRNSNEGKSPSAGMRAAPSPPDELCAPKYAVFWDV
jgi:hypothetical protein